MTKSFNPIEWLDKPEQKATDTEPKLKVVPNYSDDDLNEVKAIIEEIEAKHIDIASEYAEWRNIGFAFADAFGETGRELFHRISKFYAEYDLKECNEQYDKCLNANGNGVSLKTFFYQAKQAGINIGKQQTEEPQDEKGMPTFPGSLYPQLPEFLQKVVHHATSDEERDIILLGSLVTLSACLPHVFGIYGGKKVYANLFLFVTAQASAGKGNLAYCRKLVSPIHKQLREESKLRKQQYDADLKAYNSKKGKDDDMEKPTRPPEKMLFIPANNSSTGAYQLLNDSEGKGLIFETEGDTLAQAFKSEHGNYSDGFRKAFHHETISYYRRTDQEYVEIENPCLSAMLSGTPKQVSTLIPNAENGLFSRFMFYSMNIKPEWNDVFAVNTDEGLDAYFDRLGAEFYELYKILQASPELRFDLTQEQKQKFNAFFQEKQAQYISLQGIDIASIVRRSGLIAFRIAMILTVLRTMETGDISERLVCTDQDYQTALNMVNVLLKHSDKVYTQMPKEETMKKRKNIRQQFLDALPKTFDRKTYVSAADRLGIKSKTAEGYIKKFVESGLLDHPKHNHYVNLQIPDKQEKQT
ncbi:DUF3987 domain-containing protein [Psychroflexus tropicus]|uniref:DUF3987 domain-containing protein n=1 Tax=Psychroflexus tropicus TaxID=197345 RepID=UPI0003617F0E|nr:DUF3987 domain-containing protein [Psychroflexus tropicus]